MEELVARYAKVPLKRRLAIFGVILAVMFAGFWSTLRAPQAEQIEELKAKYLKLEGERDEKQGYIENLPKHEARYAELVQNLNVARAQLPDDPDVPALVAQLGNKERQAGVLIQNFEPKGEAVKDFYVEITFDVKLKGSFHEVATFVDSLGKLDRIINVTDISMLAPKTQNQKVVIDSGFFLKTYRSATPAELEAAKNAATTASQKKGGKK